MKLFNAVLFYLMTLTAAFAGPGAHGPNGEHLDAPGSAYVRADATPRIDAFTESFELVGQLQETELSVLIDRYETNEPVLNGKLEVELNGVKAHARFHADHGDYAIDDVNFLKALAKPGKHALVFTLTAGEESDLLEGTLEVTAHDASPGREGERSSAHNVSIRRWAIGGVLLAMVLVAIVVAMLRRKPVSGK